MDTYLLKAAAVRTRRRHSAEFKSQVVAACQQPGVSIAGIALANGLNANYLRKWVKAHRDQQQANATPKRSVAAVVPHLPTLVPVTLQAPSPQPSGDIQISIHRQQTAVQISWPNSQAQSCAEWLRELLR
jgi:transposase